MANAHAKVTVSADGVGFHKAMSGIEHRLEHLSGFAEGLKGSLATAFGGATIALAIENMIEFADSTIKGADALNITVKQFQALKILAEETGAEFDALAADINKIGTAADEALKGNEKQLRAFHALGINADDLKNLKDFELLQKAIAGGKELSRDTLSSYLKDLGIKNPGKILGAREQLGNFGEFQNEKEKSGQIANPDDLRQIQMLKDQFEQLTNEVKTALAPAFTWLVSIFQAVIMGSKMVGLVVFSTFTLIGKVLMDMGKFLLNLLLHPLHAGKAIDEYHDAMVSDVKEAIDTVKTGNQQLVADRVKSNEELAAKLATFDAAEAAKKNDKANRDVLSKQNVNFGTNQFLKIGGFLGADVNTRLSLVQNSIESNTKETARNTAKIVSIMSKDKILSNEDVKVLLPPF